MNNRAELFISIFLAAAFSWKAMASAHRLRAAYFIVAAIFVIGGISYAFHLVPLLVGCLIALILSGVGLLLISKNR